LNKQAEQSAGHENIFEEQKMATLLHIDSSGKGSMSVTRPLTAYFADQWKAANPDGKIIYHDLLKSELQFVNEEIVGAYYTPEDKQTDHQKSVVAKSNQFTQELLEADTYVFGVPMYNFTVPAVFKAYLDLTVRAGKTFSYVDGVPKGLLQNKRLIVVSSSGADYSEPPMSAYNFVEPYLRVIYGFQGVSDITVISAPGRDPESIASASKKAQEQLNGLVRVHQLT
jgi:FMN-dependent NADH-azoreductase